MTDSPISHLLPDTATISPEGILHEAENIQVMERRETYDDLLARYQDF